MSKYKIEEDEQGRFVLTDEETGQKTIYATEQEAKDAIAHLLGPVTVVDPDKV